MLTLDAVLTAARDRNPYFHKSRAPDAVVARYLTALQQRLISKISEHNPGAFAQQASVLFALDPSNAVGVVGAGSSGGLPAQDAGGAPVQLERPAGAAAALDFSAPIYLAQPAPCTASTDTTVAKAGAAWVVNAFIGKYAWITDGPGIEQRRVILSNTADTLVISNGADGEEWGTLPLAGVSRFAVVDVPPVIADDLGVVTSSPALAERQGYLVRLDAAGVPYIDLARPLVAKFDAGIALPPHESILNPATVRFDDDSNGTADLTIGQYSSRWSSGSSGYASYIMNGELYLVGDQRTWARVASIDLRYVPIAPAFSALTDFFLLRDDAFDTLAARAALMIGQRVAKMPDVPDGAVDVRELKEEAAEAEAQFLSSSSRSNRRAPKSVQSVW